MELSERIKNSETRQFKVVFHNTLNDRETLFGGEAMKWMDEVAYITATRFARKKMVTLSTEKIKFMKPIPFGTIAEVIGKIVKVGTVKLEILVEVFTEQMYSYEREKVIEGIFIFVAVNDKLKAIRLIEK